MDTLVRGLSLLFSTYSPLYNTMALFQWLLFRKVGRIVLLGGLVTIECGLEWKLQNPIVPCLILFGLFLLGFTLQRLWSWSTRHYTLSLLTFYPLHPWLRKCIYKKTGYFPTGDLYEVHVTDSRLQSIAKKTGKKTREFLQEIVRCTKADSQHVTEKYLVLGRPFAIIGVTYTDSFGRVGYRSVRHRLQQVCYDDWIPRLGQRLLFPGKQWWGFVWIN